MVKFIFIIFFFVLSIESNEFEKNTDSNYGKYLKKALYFIGFPPYAEREELVILLEQKKQIEANLLKAHIIYLIQTHNLSSRSDIDKLYQIFKELPNLGGIEIFHWNRKVLDYSYRKVENYKEFSFEFEKGNYRVLFFLTRKSNYYPINFDTLAYNSDYFYFQKDGSLLYHEEKTDTYPKKIPQIEKKLQVLLEDNPYIYKNQTEGFIVYIIPNFTNYIFFSILIGKILLFIVGLICIFYIIRYFKDSMKDKQNIYKQLEKIIK